MAVFSTQPAAGTLATAGNQDNLISNEIITDSGIVTITPTAGNTPTSATIVFNKTFPTAPKVMCTASSTAPGTAITGVSASSITTTGCLVWLTRTNTTASQLMWFAVLTQ